MGEVRFMKREKDSHWYHPDGRACHELPYADPKKEGMRATTLRDARKLGLLPSVTNILQMKAKPALDVWKLEQAVLAAITLPRKEGETDDEFAKRVEEDMQKESRAAAEWGTQIHDQIEAYNKEGAFSGTGEILDYVAGYETWFRENVAEVIVSEQSVVGSLGYAGRSDINVILKRGLRRAVIDIKTQKLKGRKAPAFYKEWAMQLAAYGDADRDSEKEAMPILISLVIPSDEPGPAFEHVWDDPMGALDAFHACYRLWCYDKGYTPPAP